MRKATLVGFASALVIGLTVAGCGSGDDSTTPTGQSTTQREATQPSSAQQGQKGEGEKQATDPSSSSGTAGKATHKSPKQEEVEERVTYEKERYGLPSHRSAGFRHSARQGVLRHVPEYGDEAKPDEREQAQAVLAAYLGAVDEHQWGKACEYLLPYYVSELEKIARASTGAPRDCAEALQRTFKQIAELPGSQFPDLQTPKVASFRVKPYPSERAAELELDVEQSGFVLIHASDGEDYYATLTREGGTWLLSGPFPHPLRG